MKSLGPFVIILFVVGYGILVQYDLDSHCFGFERWFGDYGK